MAEEGNRLDLTFNNGAEDEGSGTVIPFDTQSGDTDKIRNDIDDTRVEMGRTIDEIQDRLSLSNISEQVSEHVTKAVDTATTAAYDATVGRASKAVSKLTRELAASAPVKTVKENPLPFLLIGAGAGLFAYSSFFGRRSHRSSADRRAAASTENGSGLDLGGKLDRITGAVSSTATGAYHSVEGAIGGVYEGAGDFATAAYSRASDLGSSAKDQYDHHLEERPLALGAIAFAVGAAVGLSVPISGVENDLLGPKRDELFGMARSTASDLASRAGEMLCDAVDKSTGTETGTVH